MVEEKEETYSGVGRVVEKGKREELVAERMIGGQEGREGGECARLVEDLGLGLRVRAFMRAYEVGRTGFDDGLEQEGRKFIPFQKRSILHSRFV